MLFRSVIQDFKMAGKLAANEFSFATNAKSMTDMEVIPVTVPMFLSALPIVGTAPLRRSVNRYICSTQYTCNGTQY